MKQIWNWCKKHSSEIVVGIVCTFLSTFIINIASAIKELTPVAGNSIIKFISGYFFYCLSIQSSLSILITIFASLIGFCFASVLSSTQKLSSSSKRAINLGKKTLDFSKNSISPLNSKDLSESLKDILTSSTDLIKTGKKNLLVSRVFQFFALIYLIFTLCFYLLPLCIFSTYTNDIKKIAPYISDHELKQIESNWACMRESADFDSLYNRINDIKNSNNLP